MFSNSIAEKIRAGFLKSAFFFLPLAK